MFEIQEGEIELLLPPKFVAIHHNISFGRSSKTQPLKTVAVPSVRSHLSQGNYRLELGSKLGLWSKSRECSDRGSDACQGDSGASIIWSTGTADITMGVSSYGKTCGEGGVYARNDYDWIISKLIGAQEH